MNTFQLLALPVTTIFAIRSLWVLLRGGRPVGGHAIISGMWIAASLAILDPELTNRVARLLGIGRGADLVIYVVAMGFMMAFFYFYRKYRRLSSDITTIVRELALQEAQRTEGLSDAASSDAGYESRSE